MADCTHSCVDCATLKCGTLEGSYPEFCLTTHMDEEVLDEAMACYEDDATRQVMLAAAEVEYEHYGKYTRVEEIAEFARLIACKAGTQKKTSLGIPEKCEAVGVNICNPILQAKLLNKAGTDLNIVVGLCVGHDSLFYKHSDALVTTAIVKDRVLGHNPAAALYTIDSFYKRLKV